MNHEATPAVSGAASSAVTGRAHAPAAKRATLDWSAANQQLLAAEFRRLACCLDGQDAQTQIAAVRKARAAMPTPSAIDALCAHFGLSDFERDVLLLSAGAEMDDSLARACAHAQPQQPWASFGLALARLPGAHWSALAPVGPLRRWQLVRAPESGALVHGHLRADERVLHYLAGVNHVDARLHALLRLQPVAMRMAQSHAEQSQHVAQMLRESGSPAPLALLVGDDAQDLADVAVGAAAVLGLRLYALRAEDLPQDIQTLEALATVWQRDALLLQGALLVRFGDERAPASALRFIERAGSVVFATARQPLRCERAMLHFAVEKPSPQERLQLWQQALPAHAGEDGTALQAVAGQFRMGAASIREAASSLAPALARGGEASSQVWDHCRLQMRNGMHGLAARVDTISGWDDLVLPAAQIQTLRQIASHLRHRRQVHQQWGFAAGTARGLGVSSLFAGESGTGKTMAAEVLARELRLDLYRVDLSAVVSKYIGETEKNLRRVFDAAEDSGAVLLFDEADALFGKRSEVKDSHDRYANVEISYLLQRMESYQGLAILTTNFKAALDPAFQRRLRFVVQFAFPDQAEREALWRKVFPAPTPLEALDYPRLARLQVTGGSIRNIALHAAFLAAEDERPVSMLHLLRGAQMEMAKSDRPMTEAFSRDWI